jgi:hypothetical protein
MPSPAGKRTPKQHAPPQKAYESSPITTEKSSSYNQPKHKYIHCCPHIALVGSIAHCRLFANGITHLKLSCHSCYHAGAGAATGLAAKLAATDVLLLRVGQDPNLGMIGWFISTTSCAIVMSHSSAFSTHQYLQHIHPRHSVPKLVSC